MRTLQRHFITGILVLTPTVMTIWILYRLFVFLDGLLGGFFKRATVFGVRLEIPGLGVVSLILLILLVGILTNNILGRRALQLWERAVSSIPLVNRVFTAIKQISEAILANRETQFRRVVLIEYPRRGLLSLAFVVRPPGGVLRRKIGEGHLTLFVPTTPNPTSGFFLIVPEADVMPMDLTVEEGLKLVISAGTVMPGEEGDAARNGTSAGAVVFRSPPPEAPAAEPPPRA